MRNPEFKKLYPAYRSTWWDSVYNPLGNDWEPLPFPLKRKIERRLNWFGKLFGARAWWFFRNPLHNFFAEWIGFLGRDAEVVANRRFGSDTRHILFRVVKANKFPFYYPAVSVRLGWFEGFIGWRIQGQFQIQANLEHRKEDKY